MVTTEQFIRHLTRYGIARSNKFRVRFDGLTIDKLEQRYLQPGDRERISERLTMYVDIVELPVKTLNFTSARFRKMPYEQVFDNLPMQFKVSEDLFEKRVIDAWMANIIDKYSDYVKYQNEYQCDIIIEVLHAKTGEVVHAVKLADAFPIVMSPIELNHSDMDSYMRVNVSFAFRFWDIYNDAVENQAQTGSSFTSSLPNVFSGPSINFKDKIGIIPSDSGGGLRGLTTRITDSLKTTKGFLNLDQGETLNFYNKLNNIVTQNTGLSINETKRFVEQVKRDIDSIEDADVLSSDNKSGLLNGADDLLNILS